ncbi:MAG: ABC transporter substrate-binding protein [Microbacterium sp.]|uniref:ABC transporter substrate-binding protein n=1 Tax=Microbacterium sp. TaxID=51671 RepID=UPI0039E2A55D
MTIHRRRLTVAAAVFAVLGLTACSNASMSGNSGGGVADLSGDVPTGVTITMWHNTADSQALLDLYQAYEDYSGNTIELVDIPSASYTKDIQVKWATGERPDLMEWSGNPIDVSGLNVPDNMLDLSDMDFVQAGGQIAQQSGVSDGKTYAATLGPLGIRGIFYNKDVFAQLGLDEPQTYDDLIADCAAVQSSGSGVDTFFEAAGSGYPQSILAVYLYLADSNIDDAYIDAVTSGEEKINDPDGAFVKALTQYDELRTSGCFNSDAATAKIEDARNALWNGEAAMMGDSVDAIAVFDSLANGDTDAVDSKIGFVTPSVSGQTAPYTFSPLGTFYVPETGDSDKERVALDFIEFATGQGYQDYVDEATSIPTLDTATTPEMQGLWQEVADQYEASASLGINAGIPGFGNIGDETMKLTAGQSTPQQVADNMQAYYDQAVAAAAG